MTIPRRAALGLGLAGLSATQGGDGGSAGMFRRLGVAFGTNVSVAVEAETAEAAEAAPALLARFGAEGLFVGKEGKLWRTSGFAIAEG